MIGSVIDLRGDFGSVLLGPPFWKGPRAAVYMFFNPLLSSMPFDGAFSVGNVSDGANRGDGDRFNMVADGGLGDRDPFG